MAGWLPILGPFLILSAAYFGERSGPLALPDAGAGHSPAASLKNRACRLAQRDLRGPWRRRRCRHERQRLQRVVGRPPSNPNGAGGSDPVPLSDLAEGHGAPTATQDQAKRKQQTTK
jgi:hypothetical protein